MPVAKLHPHDEFTIGSYRPIEPALREHLRRQLPGLTDWQLEREVNRWFAAHPDIKRDGPGRRPFQSGIDP